MAMTKRRKHTHAAMLAVDYPRQGETITSPVYTIRVFAPGDAKRVGISIDQGPWKACRAAVGYWWYDWSGYGSGEHEVSVSVENSQGRRILSEPHEFFVELVVEPSVV